MKIAAGYRILTLAHTNLFLKFCSYDNIYRNIANKQLLFDYTAVAGSGKVGPVNQVNHTSWVAVVTPTDRPKSVRSRCIIELFL